MTEVRIEVRAFSVDRTCVCGKGPMRPLDYVLTTYPPLFPHQCTVCGAKQNFRVRYPYLDYEAKP